MLNNLIDIFSRDVENAKKEVLLYSNESDLWKRAQGINNSAGNLALHIIGNLNHFIGAQLGNSGFIRNRHAEFDLENIERDIIIHELELSQQMIENVLAKYLFRCFK